MLARKLRSSPKRSQFSITRWGGISDDDFMGTCTAESQNFRIQDGDIKNRLGSSRINIDIGTTGRKNIVSWKRKLNADVTLVSQLGSEVQIYVESQDAWVTIPNSITSENRQYYENYRNELTLVNGVDNGRLQDTTLTFASAPTTGDTSETLASNWTGITGDYPVDFSGGDYRLVTLTNGASTCTWTGALTADATTSEKTVAYDEPFTGLGTEKLAYLILSKGQFIGWTTENPNQTKWGNFEERDGTGDDIYDFEVTTTSPPTKAGGVESQDDRMTSLAQLSDKNWVMTTESGVYSVNYEYRDPFYFPQITPIFKNTGAVNPRCLKVAIGTGMFLANNKKIYMVRPTDQGLLINPISDGTDKKPGIKNLLATLKDDQSESFAEYNPEEKIFWFFVSQKGFSLPNIAIGYDTINGVWLKDERQYLAACQHEGKMYLTDQLVSQVYLDQNGGVEKDAQNITFKYYTNVINLEKPSDRKQWYRTIGESYLGPSVTLSQQIVVGSGGQTTKLEYSQGAGGSGTGPSAAVGTFAVGTNSVGIGASGIGLTFTPMVIDTRLRGYNAQIYFDNTGPSQEFKIGKNFDIEYRLLPRNIIPSNIKKA